MQLNEPNDIELSLFYKILTREEDHFLPEDRLCSDGQKNSRTGSDKHAISGIDRDEVHKA
jgi:hypothetical protein